MLNMKKLETKDGNDGLYELKGGMLYTSIVDGMKNKGNFEEDKLDITIDFDGAHSEVVFNDIFTYSTKKDKLTVSGFSGFLEGDGDSITADYKIEGDTLTIVDTKSTEKLTRVK